MKGKFSHNSRSVVAPFIAILTLLIAAVALAQTFGTDQPSSNPIGLLTPPATSPFAQAERPLSPWWNSAERLPSSGSHKNKSGALPMDEYPLQFLPVVTYDAGGLGSSSLTVGDLNGDGYPDIVVTNTGSTSVDVLLGNGDGTFRAPVSYSSGAGNPWSVAIADVNGDGKPDLIIATFGGTVGVLLGNGDGTFQAPVSYSTGAEEAFSVAIGDLRGNGHLDLVVANWCPYGGCENGVLSVLLGNGDGTFQAAVTYSSGGYQSYSVAIADVNGDGKLDLVASNNCLTQDNCSDGGVSVLLGNGDGTFQAAVSYSAGGSGTESVAIGDVNGDGRPDVLLANGCIGFDECDNGSVSVLLGNGDGTFQAPVSYSSGGVKAFSVALGDVNGDGYPDLVVANVNSSSIGVLLGNGDGTFQPAASYDSGGLGAYFVAVADVNGDGKLDVVVANCNGTYCAPGSDGEGEVGVLVNDSPYTPAASTTTLTSSPNPSNLGQVVTFTASVSAETGTPTGTVEFFDGNVALGSAKLASGNALFPVSWLAAGSDSITAKFQGDGKYLSSASSPLIQVVNRNTATSLASSLNPSVFGQTVTFTVVVSSALGTPIGTVTFYDGTTAIGNATLTSGSASLSISSVAAGSQSITAAYQGSGVFNPSTSAPLNQVVNPATTSTSLASSQNPAVITEIVTYTATIASQFGGAATGTVVFQDGGSTVATVSIGGNKAAYSAKYSSVGTHSMTATYSGDNNNSGSGSTALVEQINKGFASTTALTTSGSPSLAGQPVTFTAMVTSTHGFIRDGELVTFYDDTTAMGTSATASGVATFTTSSLDGKRHLIKATYPGDETFRPSTGSVTQVVSKNATTTALSSSLNPSVQGQAVTFTATVASAGPLPTGKVKFMDGTKLIGEAQLSGGVATFVRSKLTPGTHPITAHYVGDTNSNESTSAVLDQVVQFR